MRNTLTNELIWAQWFRGFWNWKKKPVWKVRIRWGTRSSWIRGPLTQIHHRNRLASISLSHLIITTSNYQFTDLRSVLRYAVHVFCVVCKPIATVDTVWCLQGYMQYTWHQRPTVHEYQPQERQAPGLLLCHLFVARLCAGPTGSDLRCGWGHYMFCVESVCSVSNL